MTTKANPGSAPHAQSDKEEREREKLKAEIRRLVHGDYHKALLKIVDVHIQQTRTALLDELERTAPEDFKDIQAAFHADKIDWNQLQNDETFNAFNAVNAKWRALIKKARGGE